MTEDIYTLGENTGNLWLEYEVKKDGVVDFSCNVPFNFNYWLGVAKNSSDAVSSLVNSDYKYTRSYQGVIPVAAGDKLYFQVNMAGDVKGKTLTINNRDSKPGETITNPLVIKKGETVDLTIAGSTKPLWIKPQMTDGENKFIVYDGSCVPMCNCRESGDGINYDGNPVAWGEEVTMPDGSYGVTLPISDYVMINSVEGNAKLLFVDETASGITNVEVANDSKPSIYTLDGRKIDQIAGSGVYVIKSNGTTKKVVIKK